LGGGLILEDRPDAHLLMQPSQILLLTLLLPLLFNALSDLGLCLGERNSSGISPLNHADNVQAHGVFEDFAQLPDRQRKDGSVNDGGYEASFGRPFVLAASLGSNAM
jgi:hypothetical protein